jgi:hypothetical protein
LAQWALNHKEDPEILSAGIGSIVLILGLVFLCARNEVALYKSSIWIGFHVKYLLGTDTIYKYYKNTTPRMIRQFTKIISMSKKGGIKFHKCQTYNKNSCNRGFVYLVNPASIQDYGAFVATMKRLYNSLPPGAEYKEIIVGASKQPYFSILSTERLGSFKGFLPVMKGSSGHMQINIFRISYFKRAPFPVSPIGTNIAIGFHIPEWQIFPVYINHDAVFYKVSGDKINYLVLF